MLKAYTQLINLAEILGGTPVFDYLETGETIETFLEDFEGVKKNR